MTVREWLALSYPDADDSSDYVWIMNTMPNVTGEDDPFIDVYIGPKSKIPSDALFLDDDIVRWAVTSYAHRSSDGTFDSSPALVLVI